MALEKAVLFSNNDGIVILTLNRPEAANSLSKRLLQELQAAIEECMSDASVRCVIVTGAGDRAFCAGADLKERAGMSEEETRSTVAVIRETIANLETLPMPVLAAINGAALGGGLELALACDIRIAAQTAKLGLTETSLGIIPGAGGTQRLPRLVGIGRAKELVFTARRIEAEDALRIGLIEYMAPASELLAKTMELAVQIARNAPIALAQSKHAIHHGLQGNLASGLVIEQRAYEATLPTKDRLEGLRAFKEKRQPVYRGE
jgi:methylglutaconyl-CoA hydratase